MPADREIREPRRVEIGDRVILQPDADNEGPTLDGHVVAFMPYRGDAQPFGCFLLAMPAAVLPRTTRTGLVVKLAKTGNQGALRFLARSKYEEAPDLVVILADRVTNPDPVVLPYYSVEPRWVDLRIGVQFPDGSVSAGPRFHKGACIGLADQE